MPANYGTPKHLIGNEPAFGDFIRREDKMNKPRVTIEQVMEAIESGDCIGFCLGCGAEARPVEPDARRQTCESCGMARVYGAEELLIMMAG